MSLISIVIATAVALTLRIIALLVFASGMAALAVGLTAAFIPNEFVSIGYVLSGVGLSLAITAGISLTWLPWRTSATRFTPSVVQQSRPAFVVLFAMTVLSLLLVTQLRPIADSWQQSIDILDSLGFWNVAGGPQDPLGFSLIPLVALLSIPIWQTMTVASFLLTSLLVMLLRAKAIPRILGACTLLQFSLVAGCFLIGTFLEAGSDLAETIFGEAEPSIRLIVEQWIRPRAAAASQIALGLAPFSLGYIGAWLWIYLHPQVASSEPTEPSVTAPSAILSREIHIPNDDTTHAYSVHPVLGSMATFTWISGGYDVFTGSPPAASKHVLSFRGGRMLSHPDGKEILIMKRRGVLSPTWELREPSGRIIAVLQYEENEWFVLHPAGKVISRTSRTLFQPRYCEFTTSIENVTVARYIWRQTWFKPELRIEFSGNGAERLDRRIGIALATILERKARISTFQKFG